MELKESGQWYVLKANSVKLIPTNKSFTLRPGEANKNSRNVFIDGSSDRVVKVHLANVDWCHGANRSQRQREQSPISFINDVSLYAQLLWFVFDGRRGKLRSVTSRYSHNNRNTRWADLDEIGALTQFNPSWVTSTRNWNRFEGRSWRHRRTNPRPPTHRCDVRVNLKAKKNVMQIGESES